MPFLLCIETATPVCSVAVFENEKLLALKEIAEGNVHASALTGLIEHCLKEAGTAVNELDAIAVSKGPGSYTGLRVGVATAKGLCYTLNKPLVAVSTLEGLCTDFLIKNPEHKGLVCPMIDARRMEVYTVLYTSDGSPLTKEEAKIVANDSYQDLLATQHITFIGNGAQKCQESIRHNHAFFKPTQCSASGLGQPAYRKLLTNNFEDLAYFEPDYLKEYLIKQ